MSDRDLMLMGLVGIVLFWVSRNARAVGSAVAETAGEVAVGAVEGLGQVIGIPPTNQTQCQRDIAAGDWWEASFSCPAGDFLGAVWGASTS